MSELPESDRPDAEISHTGISHTGESDTAESDDELLARRLRHLETAERLAGIGSWQGYLTTEHGIFWSPTTYEIAGWPPDTPVSFDSFLQILHPDDRDSYLRKRDAALRSGAPYVMDLRMLRPDGEVRHVHLDAEIEHLPSGDLHLIGVVHDRTAHVEARREIDAAAADVAALLRSLLLRGERERADVADRVHDVPLHAAVTASMLLDTVELAGAVAEEVVDIRTMIDAAIDSLRSVVTDVAPTELGDDLEQALLRASRAAGPNTDVDVQVESGLELTDMVRRIIVRLAQESVRNVRKHAVASNLVVTVRSAGDEVILEVEDDGRGFDPRISVGRPGHLGITAMRERAAAAGGVLEIESRPGLTVVRAVLPAR